MLTGRFADMIKRHEGLMLSAYKCPTGHNTIGYGHNIEANPLRDIDRYIDHHLAMTGEITIGMAEWLLDQDIISAGKSAEIIIKASTWSNLNDTRRAVIISMIFNLGIGGFMKFMRVNDALDAGDWPEAAEEMKDSTWYRQVGSRGKELSRMMRSGEWS